MPFTDPPLAPSERATLLEIARASIQHGLYHQEPLAPEPAAFAPALRQRRATFVTLHRRGQLRGCIGTLEARAPLVIDVAAQAYAAAFEDPRFPRLDALELVDLELHISVLSPAQPLRFSGESDLLRQLQPGIDGLILRYREKRGTFLPAVWESLPQSQAFFRQLKLKAGLAEDFWADDMSVERYTAESFP
jgi:hypothetical protein